MKKVAVIGSGLIGRSYAMLFASGGYRVELYDLDPEQVDKAKADIKDQLEVLEKQGLLRGALSREEQFNLITGVTDLSACAKGAFFVQTNPPFYAPLVELVPASWTDPDVVPTTRELLSSIGLVPVLVKKEVPGFVLNRLQFVLLGEAWKLIRDEVTTATDLDKFTLMPDSFCTIGHRIRSTTTSGKLSPSSAIRRTRTELPWPLNPDSASHMYTTLTSPCMYSCRDRYGDVILGVQQDQQSPPEKMEGPVLDRIHKEMEAVAGPVSDLQKRRQWRDRRLAKLAKLKAEMDDEDKEQ
ncbi:hypothetical protein BaRGS_00005437 [Batillaria attramentaria]|uniref:3-hydroxyacyl-CoA dehydrogenase NAD binding domain-containing protein n=1 Tax=Batillaria attramentaria TaxID=370345 RepID=A0ABD0LW41_9CAEN